MPKVTAMLPNPKHGVNNILLVENSIYLLAHSRLVGAICALWCSLRCNHGVIREPQGGARQMLSDRGVKNVMLGSSRLDVQSSILIERGVKTSCFGARGLK